MSVQGGGCKPSCNPLSREKTHEKGNKKHSSVKLSQFLLSLFLQELVGIIMQEQLVESEQQS